MFISEISLKDFRNLEKIKLKPTKGINVFFGDNAQGKTNFLESVYFCANGRSMRSNTDKDMICFGKNEAHIQAIFEKNGISDKIDVHLKSDGKKGVAVNGIVIKKLGDLIQNVFVVLFAPENLSLLKNGPSERRKLMDRQLCRLSGIYMYNLQQYYKVLNQRNSLLKTLKKKRHKEEYDMLFVWNAQLVQYGTKIIIERRKFVETLKNSAIDIHSELSGKKERLDMIYKPSVTEGEFLNKLENGIDRDIILGTTCAGIHKDDVLFLISEKDAKFFGSQGQQRTACLSIVLAEIEIIRKEKCEDPILLLDDVLSELDEKRRNYLFKFIKPMQTIITCTDAENITRRRSDAKLFKVANGEIFEA